MKRFLFGKSQDRNAISKFTLPPGIGIYTSASPSLGRVEAEERGFGEGPLGFGILLHIFIARAKDVPAEFAQSFFTCDVLFTNLIVLSTVNFDNKLLRLTGEVDNESTDGMLASEFQTA